MAVADRPEIEVAISIAAAVDEVWARVSDTSLPVRYSSELQEVEWVDERRGVGARFRGRNRHPAAGEWTSTSIVTEWDPGRVFAWAVSDVDDPAAEWRFLLEPEPTGTRLRFRARLGPGPSGLTAVIAAHPDREDDIIARRLDEWRANMTATVEGVKAEAEQGPAAPSDRR